MGQVISIPSNRADVIRYGNSLISEKVMKIIIETRKANGLETNVSQPSGSKQLLLCSLVSLY